MELIVKQLEDLSTAASTLLSYAGERKKMTFTGEIGAGKTTFIQQICAQLGVEEAVTSPTFSLVNEYEAKEVDGRTQSVYHLDLYRLKNEQEAINMGIEEYLYSENYCFIEWPELINDLILDEMFTPNTRWIRINIETLEDSTRKIIIL